MNRKKRFLRTIASGCCSALMLGAMQIAASAASKTQDGIEAALTANVSDGNMVNAQLTLSNTNRFDLENIGISYDVPEGYSIGSSLSSVALLKSGESVSLDIRYDSLDAAPETTAQQTQATSAQSTAVSAVQKNVSAAKTGDSFPLALMTAIALASGTAAALCIRKKGGKKMLSLILCAAICGSGAGNFRVLRSDAAEELDERTFEITETVQNGSEQIRISVTITYHYPNGETQTEQISFRLEDTMYDSGTDTYYLFNEKKMLSGQIRDPEDVASVSYSITDCNDKELMSGTLEPSESWEIDNLGLIVGENFVTITVEYEDETEESRTITINNLCEENMDPLHVDKGDTDQDGVLNFTEELYHTDPEHADTDGDRLSDYDEMATLGTDPSEADTDHNGITDDLEDFDGDQLTNYDEIYVYHTDPVAGDTDFDYLSDYDEVNVYHTDPNEADTDQDGADDFWEIQNGFDPLVPDEDFGETDPYAEDSNTVVMDDGTEITLIPDDAFLDEETPGYIGADPFYIELSTEHGEKEPAEITIPVDAETVRIDEDTGLFRLDEETQCLEECEAVITVERKIVAKVQKSGTYILLNRRILNEVLDNELLPASALLQAQGTADIVFVIDRSASMDENDPDQLRKRVVKTFIEKLRPGDRASIVQFSAVAETVMPLTSDQESLLNAVDNIQNSYGGNGCIKGDPNAGTNGAAGIRTGLDALDGSEAAQKYIVFLTDGADTTTPEGYTYSDLEKEAKGKVVIHTIGLVGTGSVNTDLLREVAKETGGNYYLASIGTPENDPEQTEDISDIRPLEEVYADIEASTIDREHDSNNDGISDYYTRLLCEGKILTATGKAVFGLATYDDVQKNDDYDGDTLKNSDEIKIIETENGVYVKVISYPDEIDSDGDTLPDDKELNVYGTSPLKKNRYVYREHTDWATDKSKFIAHSFVERFDHDTNMTRTAVTIGNKFFGTAYSTTYLYETALIDYFEEINETMYAMHLRELFIEDLDAYKNAWADQMREELEELKHSLEPEEVKKGILTDMLQDLGTVCDAADLTPNFFSGILNKTKWNVEELEGIIEKCLQYLKEHNGEWYLPKPDNISYDKHANNVSKMLDGYNECKTTLSQTRTKLTVTKELKLGEKTIKGWKRFSEGATIVVTAGSMVSAENDALEEFDKLIAQVETMEENIYILDSIVAGSNDKALQRAAASLRNAVAARYGSDMEKLRYVVDDSAFTTAVIGTVAGEAAHFLFAGLVAECFPLIGPVFAAVELARTAGNLAYNIDDVAAESSKLYAIAKTADILGDRYSEYLEAGNAVRADNLWVFYNDNSDEGRNRLYNLVVARNCAESQMITRNEANSFLAEGWFMEHYPIEEIQYNMAVCRNILSKY